MRTCSLLLALAAFTVDSTLGAAPPRTAVKIASDTYHGVTVADPYRWLEDGNDPAVKAWSDAQNLAARQVLDNLPNVDALRARVTELLSAQTILHQYLQVAGGRLFALKSQPPKQQSFLVVMASPDHPEAAQVLVDPNELNRSGTTAIDWFVASPDGKWVAVSLSDGGSESGDLHIYDTATGRQVFEVIPRVQNGTGGGSVAWLADSRSFLYTRYPLDGERPAEDRDFYMQVYRHTLGTPFAEDRYEIGRDFPKIAELTLATSSDGVALLNMQKGDGGEFQHYLRSLDGVWHQLTHYEDRVVQAVLGHGPGSGKASVYLVSLKGTPRGQLLRLAFDSQSGAGPAFAQAECVLREGPDTLVGGFGLGYDTNLLVTATRIYTTYQCGGPSEIRVFDLQGRPVAAPRQFAVGAITDILPAGDRGDAVLFRETSYLDLPAWVSFDPGSAATIKTPLSATAQVDFSDCEVVREWATSKDGTRIPVNIIRKRGLKLDGSHPCLVTGYGGYGLSMDPACHRLTRVLIDQGMVWAEANLRGGGEFGDSWHRQGNLTNKQNVFDDFYAACRHMVEAGYTQPGRLVIEGGSNGGLLMGATLTQHPEIARAVVSSVGLYDMLRYELGPNGTFNIPEFGTVKDPAQFRALFAYSPYHHVQESVSYPPVLFLTGANDPRVDPLQSRKMTARLQAVGATCLLRTSANSGHGIGSSLQQIIEENVDVDAFIFSQLGITFSSSPR